MIISKKKDVHYQLELKDNKLNSLLEITNAINLNLSTDKLLKIYAFILKEQLGFRKFVLLHANESWIQREIRFSINSATP
jgi:sigma-B regulation protein RsbU (phosphoserine phosphatase)